MRKRGRTINRRARALPGIVVQACDMRYELRLRECVEAFRHGCADGAHHDEAEFAEAERQIQTGGF